MKHRVGRAAHGNIHRHGVFKRREGGDAARQDRIIIVFIIAFGESHDAPPSVFEQLLAFVMGGEQTAIAGLSQSDGFSQTIHGIGGEHAGTRTACGTRTALITQ